MKLALKYGLFTAVGMMLWVIIAHLLVPNPGSIVHSLGAFTFFNLLHFSMIYLGLKALERERQGKIVFKEAVKTGVAISFVYAVAASLFFSLVLLVIGPKWLQAEAAGPTAAPTWVMAAQAFIGLFLFTMIFGLVYSTLLSFMLAKRRSSET